MSVTVPGYRWSVSEYLRAWDAKVLDYRVELIGGELWPVVVGDWHGRMVGRVIGLLFKSGGGEITSSTLPSGGSLPDPDCWVLRTGAEPVDQLSPRMSRWDPADVLLVVEVSDETVLADLNVKARLYGAAGYATYWVVTEDVAYEHTGPTPQGYRHCREHRAGDVLPIAHAGTGLAVERLLTLG